MIWLQLVLDCSMNFLVHQRFDLMWPSVSDNDQSAVIAYETGQVLVRQHLWEGFENRRLGRVVHVLLDFIAGLAAQFPHERVKNTKNVEIISLLRRPVENC